jgi:hypothetical protein
MSLPQRVRRAIAVPIILLLSWTLLSESASAHPLKYKWEDTGHTMGYCSLRSGEFVKWVQSEMWVLHRYPNMYSSNVDGVWGAKTDTAVKSWQSANGLTADGCVGWATRRSLRRYPYLTYLYNSNYTDFYRAQGPYSEYVTYKLAVCWQWQWFDGGHSPNDTACTNAGSYEGSPYDGTVGRP